MLEKRDIYSYDRRLENLEKAFEKFSKENRNLILRFKNDLFLQNLSKARVVKCLDTMKCFTNLVESTKEISINNLGKLTKEDLQYLIGIIQQRPYSAWTKQGYKVIIRKFVCWSKGCEKGEIAQEIKWLKTGFNKKAERKLPGEGALITKEEVDKAIQACESIRDKALLSMIYESGCRIGEIASLKIGNLIFDKYGVQINVIGKTGARRIRLVHSSFLMRVFLDGHPFKDDKNAFLWYNSERDVNEPICYNAFKNIIIKAFKKAGIKKRCNPHLFRHSRATEMASFLTEFQMNQYFGWTQGSEMPSTYVHMNGKEVDSAVLAMNGITPIEDQKLHKKPVLCKRCEFLNPIGTEFCLKCSLPLEEKAIIELDQREKERRKVDLIMDELIKQPEVCNLIMEKIKSLGLTAEILK